MAVVKKLRGFMKARKKYWLALILVLLVLLAAFLALAATATTGLSGLAMHLHLLF